MRPKQQVKPQPRHFYLWRRTNVYDETSLDALSIMHHISPVGYARLSCLAEKFEILFGSVYWPVMPDRISPLFDFLILRAVCYDYISSEYRKTDSLTTITDELIKGFNRIRDASKIAKITEEVSRIHVYFHGDGRNNINNLSRQPLERVDSKELIQVQFPTDNRNNIEPRQHLERMDPKKTDRITRLKEAELYELRQMKNFLKEYLRIRGQSLEEWEGNDPNRRVQRQKAEWQFDQVRRLDLLSMPQQYMRWQAFEKLHKKFFGCTFMEDKRTRPYIYTFKMNRPSPQSEPVLMRLEQHMQLRALIDYGPQAALFIKDMVQQLKKFHIQTSNFEEKQKHYYSYLSPHNVVFDQITLRPKLSYQPYLLEVLGLKKRPLSQETMISWFCTPRQFDYFQGEKELEHESKLKLHDSMYGAELYYRKVQGDTISKQALELRALEESSCVDRLLLTSHYLLNGKEFGRPEKPISYKHIEQHFQKALSMEKAALRDGRRELKEWLGPAAAKVEGGIELGFWEIVQALTEEEADSVVQNQRFTRIIRYLNLRYTFVREVVAALTNERLFQKISNPKKYIILFLVFGVQYLEEIRLICVQGSRGANVPVLRRYMDENGKKLRSGFTVGSSLETTFNKIEDYRLKANRDQNRFLIEEEGIKLLQACNKLNKSTMQQRQKLDKVCYWMKEGRKQSKDRAKEEISHMWERIGKMLEESNKVLSDFVKVETKMKYANGPHRLPEDKTMDFAELYLQTTRRFQLTIRALLTSTPQNYLVYDTLIGRLLHLDNPDYFKELTDVAPPALEKLLKVERSALDHADDMLGISARRVVAGGTGGAKHPGKKQELQAEGYKL